MPVLMRMAEGVLNKQIAHEPASGKYHKDPRGRVLQKLECPA